MASDRGIILSEARFGGTWGEAEQELRDKLDVRIFINLRRLGTKDQRAAILKSDMVIFTGHHLMHVGGEAGQFSSTTDASDPLSFRMKRVMAGAVASKVQLVIIAGCYGLEPEMLDLFRQKFPNAALIGFIGSSPGRETSERHWEFMSKFARSIPDNPKFPDDIVNAWKEWIETASTSHELLIKRPTRRSPGIYLPETWQPVATNGEIRLVSRGTLYYWNGTKWITQKVPRGKRVSRFPRFG